MDPSKSPSDPSPTIAVYPAADAVGGGIAFEAVTLPSTYSAASCWLAVPVAFASTALSVNATWCHLPSPITDPHVVGFSRIPLISPSTQPLEFTHKVGGFPPEPDPVDSSVPALVAVNHNSTDSPTPPAAVKYPPGMVISESLPPKLAAVPSANPVGPVTPRVTFAYVAAGRGSAAVAAPATTSCACGPDVSFSGQKSSGPDARTASSYPADDD